MDKDGRDKQKTLDAERIISELEKGGATALALPYYEARPSQLDLMRLIIRAFNEDSLAAAEAGTGVGKSFAYLLPAIVFASENDERIVISTATITLQRQLFEKDIPVVSAALNIDLKTALVTGRRNFLCLERLSGALAEAGAEFDFDNKETIRRIAAWAEITKTGDKPDLPFMPPEDVWSRVSSEPDACLGMSCPEYGRCFFMAMRRKAAEARILVVNHHLLFADLAARGKAGEYGGTVVLPAYQRIIIDEAHTIESAATSFFSAELNKMEINLTLGRLFKQRGTARSGLLLRLFAFSGGEDKTSLWNGAVNAVRNAAAKLDTAALELCGTKSVFRFIPPRDDIINQHLVPFLIDLQTSIVEFIKEIKSVLNAVEEKDFSGNEKAASGADTLLRETHLLSNRLAETAELCGAFVKYKDYPANVFWLERRCSRHTGTKDWAVLQNAPVDVSEKLKTSLFEKHKTVICLSATLAAVGRFDYWADRSGIKLAVYDDGGRRDVLTGKFPSPFPFDESVLTAAALDAPSPLSPSFNGFVNNAIPDLVMASEGSALILFTSFESLKSAYKFAAPCLEAAGIKCLKQGDDDRSRLLRAFIDDEKSTLFATDSFWEGVDAPGETLRLVIICRLPFKTPDDPVFEARCETIERRGGNPFMDISVPEAVIKFRQGFGRLMRHSGDRGVVAVLDGRILTKRYGEIFLRSIPRTKTSFGSFPKILRDIKDFFALA
ncbi:MAG: ATP-dependent DNA helicase DinG [Spirochaetaceae bacterium]|jgi:ATP-dependent DNA helicase DinG|nr:ATP-dependent DNA helicase DinG [Spirochaetaceae bacterium]